MAHDKSLPILQNPAVNENKMHLCSLCEHLIFSFSLPLPAHTHTHTHTHKHTRTHMQGLLMYESRALALIVQL